MPKQDEMGRIHQGVVLVTKHTHVARKVGCGRDCESSKEEEVTVNTSADDSASSGRTRTPKRAEMRAVFTVTTVNEAASAGLTTQEERRSMPTNKAKEAGSECRVVSSLHENRAMTRRTVSYVCSCATSPTCFKRKHDY